MESPINFQYQEALKSITLARIKETWKAATPGPWGWRYTTHRKMTPVLWGEHGVRPIILQPMRQGMQGAALEVRDLKRGLMIHPAEYSEVLLHPDLHAIEQAPAHVAWLLGEVERLQAENARLAAAVDDFTAAANKRMQKEA